MPNLSTPFGKCYYHDHNEEGSPVIFLHGNSLSSSSWSELSVNDKNKFRSILLDLPGHGRSEHSNDPEGAYNVIGYAQVVTTLADALDLESYAIVGHSLGGHIALETFSADERCTAVLCIGTPPLGIPPDMAGAFHPHQAAGLAYQATLTEEQAGMLAAALAPDTFVPSLVKDILLTDGNARQYMAASIGASKYTDELKIVEQGKGRIAFALGEQDPLINSAYFERLPTGSIWKGRVQVVSGGSHSPQLDQPQATWQVIEQFLEDMERSR